MPGRNYTSSLSFPYGYQGQEKDAATGLTNFELRQYDPRTGRWYNPDPYMQHHSPYMAMSNNPVSFTDPDGGWDGFGGTDDQWMAAHFNQMSTQNYFINGDADSRVHGIENKALVKNAYNRYRAEHTNENGEWGNYVYGQNATKDGDMHKRFEIDESAKIDNSIFSRSSFGNEWAPLPKWLLKNWARAEYCPTCSDGQLENVAGSVLENTFHAWAGENFKGPYVANRTKFGDVVPDGISVSVGYENKKLITGESWWEVKATKKRLTLSSYQIKKELDQLSMRKSNQKSYNLVTTSDVTISDKSTMLKYATDKKIFFSHMKAEYQMSTSGQIRIRFTMSYSNFPIYQYSNGAVNMQPPTILFKP